MKELFNIMAVLVAASSALGLYHILSITEPTWAFSIDYNATSNLGINTTATTATTTSKDLTVALLTDALFSDAGWGAFGYNAAQALHTKYGYEVDFRDNVSIANIESTLRPYADMGYDLIIAQGYEWGEPAVKVGLDYPNTKFVVFTGLSNSSNVASIYPMQQEATYLLGALAAMMSKTGTIGFIG